MKIKELPKIDLPREKIQKYGVSKLADYELLAVLLGSGIKGVNVLQLSKKIIQAISKIGKDKIFLEDLLEIKGLGVVKACQVLAAIEFSRHLSADKARVFSAEDVWKLCADIRNSKKEHLVAFYLDTRNQLIERQIISVGTLDASLVHPREIFEPAIALHSAKVIIAHNHPSGNPEPSLDDIEATKKMVHAGKILDITMDNHVIITEGGWKIIDVA